MEKLELRHLAPYLPYELKYITRSGKVFETKTKDSFEIRVFKGNSPNGNKQYHSLTLGKIRKGEFKPILRPLSDLYKEVNTGDNIEHYPYSTLKIPLDLAMNMDYKNINNFPHRVVNQMIEWHFDVFGLIEKGLAIDINTLQ